MIKSLIIKTRFATLLMTFFVNIASSIGFDDEISTVESAISKYLSHPSIVKIREHNIRDHFHFEPVNRENICKKLKTINIKKAYGFDNVPGKLLQIACNELSVPLTSLLNSCINQKQFPDVMKCAELCPIFKKSDKLSKTNYRPVSILTSLSKLFESVMNDQLTGYFSLILNGLVSAFRKGYGCQTLLLKCIEYWKKALSEE